MYEPGSTLKPIIVSWGLEQKKIDIDKSIYCEQGSYRMGNRILHDHHPYGTLSLEDVLVKSSNVGMAKIGERMENGTLHEGLKRFGFGRKTGIELVGELNGLLHPLPLWTDYSTGSIPMGQEIAVTPMQLITAYPDLTPSEALKRLTGLNSAIDDYLIALERGEDTDSIVLRAKTIYESIPDYRGPLPGVSSGHSLSALEDLFSEASHSAPTNRIGEQQATSGSKKDRTAELPEAQPTVPLPTAEAVTKPVSYAHSQTPEDRPARIVPVQSQPTDPLPEVDPELREIFEEEAVGIIAALGDGIRDLASNPKDEQSMRDLQRAAHTLKGAANMTGFPLIAQIGSALEMLFDAQIERDAPVERDVLELVAVSWKMLRAMLPRLDNLDSFTSPSTSIVRRANVLRDSIAAPGTTQEPVVVEPEEIETQVISTPRPAVDEPADLLDEGDELVDETPAFISIDDLPEVDALQIEATPTVRLSPEAVDTGAAAEAPSEDVVIDQPEDVVDGQLAEADDVDTVTEIEEAPAASDAPPQSATDSPFWSQIEQADDTFTGDNAEPKPFWASDNDDTPADDLPEAIATSPTETADDSFFTSVDEDESVEAEEIEHVPVDDGQWQHEPERPQTDLLSFEDHPGTQPFWLGSRTYAPDTEETILDDEPVQDDAFFTPVDAETSFSDPDSDSILTDEPVEDAGPHHETAEADSAALDESISVGPEGQEDAVAEIEPAGEPIAASLGTADKVDAGAAAEVEGTEESEQGKPEAPQTGARGFAHAFRGGVAAILAEALTATRPSRSETETESSEPAFEDEPFWTAVSADTPENDADGKDTLVDKAPSIVSDEDVVLEAATESIPPIDFDEPRAEGTKELDEVVASMSEDDGFGDLDWFEEPADSMRMRRTRHGGRAFPVPQTGSLAAIRELARSVVDPAAAPDIRFAQSGQFPLDGSVDGPQFSVAGDGICGDSRTAGCWQHFDDGLGSRDAVGLRREQRTRHSRRDVRDIRYLKPRNTSAFSTELRWFSTAIPLTTDADHRHQTGALHTIKGAAAAADFAEISDMAHEPGRHARRPKNAAAFAWHSRRFTNGMFSALEEIEARIGRRKDEIFGISQGDAKGRASVRVNVKRVDDLLNTVGELVVNRSSFQERLERLETSIEDLSNAAARLQRSSYLLDREANSEDAIGRLLRGELGSPTAPGITIGGRTR